MNSRPLHSAELDANDPFDLFAGECINCIAKANRILELADLRQDIVRDLRLAIVSSKVMLELIQKIKNYAFIESAKEYWLPALSMEEATGLPDPPVYEDEVIGTCQSTLPEIEKLLKRHEQLLGGQN